MKSIRYRPSTLSLILLAILTALVFNQYFTSQSEGVSPGRTNFRRPKFQKKPTPNPAMAAQYLKAIANRRTIYTLSKESPISNDKIQELITDTLKHTPSAFNSQAGRIVILFGKEHDKLWQIGDETVKTKLPQAYDALKDKIAGFAAGYGTVMYFEDESTLAGMKEKHPGMPFGQWSEHSSGMAQIHAWDALELEGFGANLQHYNFLPGFTDSVRKQWNLPETYDLKSQLVFGKPTAPPKEKTFAPLEDRVKVFGK